MPWQHFAIRGKYERFGRYCGNVVCGKAVKPGVPAVSSRFVCQFLEAPGGIEPPIRVLQTLALPLGYGADVSRYSYGLKQQSQ